MYAPSFGDMARVFGRIGLMSFGGPAAQIGLMHRELVDNRDWISERDFLGALSFCMLLPGPEAMQLATYTGWRLRGTAGGVLAGGLFVLPGAVLIALLGGLYVAFGDLPPVKAAFLGIKAAVIAVIIQALLKLVPKVLGKPLNRLIAVIAFLALFTGIVGFPVVIVAAGLLGAAFATTAHPTEPVPGPSVPLRKTLATIAFWGALWAVPVLAALASGNAFLGDVALFFSQLAVVTFGGAYAVLAYMVQAVVGDFGWLSTDQMIDALGLAETTPGPLILVTQFVGQLAGWQQGGWTMAAIAGALTLWCTFVPCFLWIFAGAPYVQYLLGAPRLAAALDAITAAVLGVIVNLSLWFSMHVLFSETFSTSFGTFPVLASFDPRAAALAGIACLLLLGLRLPLILVLILMSGAGLALMFLPG